MFAPSVNGEADVCGQTSSGQRALKKTFLCSLEKKLKIKFYESRMIFDSDIAFPLLGISFTHLIFPRANTKVFTYNLDLA